MPAGSLVPGSDRAQEHSRCASTSGICPSQQADLQRRCQQACGQIWPSSEALGCAQQARPAQAVKLSSLAHHASSGGRALSGTCPYVSCAIGLQHYLQCQAGSNGACSSHVLWLWLSCTCALRSRRVHPMAPRLWLVQAPSLHGRDAIFTLMYVSHRIAQQAACFSNELPKGSLPIQR